MTDTEIADLLAEHRHVRAEARAIREDLVKAAIACGLTQEEASSGKIDLGAWLDGFLMGHGVVPAYRLEKAA